MFKLSKHPSGSEKSGASVVNKDPVATSLQTLRNSNDDVFATLLRLSQESNPAHPQPGSAAIDSIPSGAKSPFFLAAPSDLRPGEKRFRQPLSPSFHNPRGRLTKLFSAAADDLDASQGGARSSNEVQGRSWDHSINSLSSAGWISLPSTNSTGSASFASISSGNNGSSVKSPTRLDGVSRILDGRSVSDNAKVLSQSPRKAFLVNSVESASKKRKFDGTTISEDSLSLSPLTTPSARPVELIRLETEIKRLQFERDSAAKLVETERFRTMEQLEQRRKEEEEISAKTTEMWAEAEKIIAENDRLKARIDKADLDAVATRKKYEDQIATIKTESIDKERNQEAALRDIRMQNLKLTEKCQTINSERAALMQKTDALKKRLVECEQLASEAQKLKGEVHSLQSQLQVCTGQLADLKNTNALLSNLSEEMRQYRELQVAVPLLQKDNQKLREKAALARANEDKILSLQETVKRYEERQCRFYDLELENEQLRSRMAEWDAPDVTQTPTKKPEGIQKLIDKIADLEASKKLVGDELATKTQMLLEATAAKESLERRVTELKSELELSEGVRARLEQSNRERAAKLKTTQTERDTLKLIKDTIDSSTTRRDPLTQTKLHDLEERANRTQTLAADFEQMYEKEAAERKQLNDQLIQLQNRYNEEHSRLNSLSTELENMRKTELARADTAEAAAAIREARGDYDPTVMQVITLQPSPADNAEKKYLQEAAKIFEDNKVLREKLNRVKASGSYSDDLTMQAEEFVQGPGEQLDDLKKQLEKLKQAKQNDFNSFKKMSGNFQQICKELLGWRVRVDSNRVVFRMSESPQMDTIVFEREDEFKPWELRPTEFTKAHAAFVTEFLVSHKSPPGFFARIILQALSDRTLICPT